MPLDLPFADYSHPADGKPPLLALIGEAPGADEIKLADRSSARQGNCSTGRWSQRVSTGIGA